MFTPLIRPSEIRSYPRSSPRWIQISSGSSAGNRHRLITQSSSSDLILPHCNNKHMIHETAFGHASPQHLLDTKLRAWTWITFKRKANQEDRCNPLLSETILGTEPLITFVENEFFQKAKPFMKPCCDAEQIPHVAPRILQAALHRCYRITWRRRAPK